MLFMEQLDMTSVVASSIYPGSPVGILTRTAEGMVACWFVNKTSDGFKGLFGRVMEFKPLLYLGRISYGLYLYHFFIPEITPLLLYRIGLHMPHSLLGESLINAAVSVLTASLSWYLIELPTSRWRNEQVPADGSRRALSRNTGAVPVRQPARGSVSGNSPV